MRCWVHIFCAAIAVLVPFVAAGPAAAKDVPAPAYFATLPFRETPFAPLVGIHPMSAEEARRRNHYYFEYDAEGRPVHVAFRLGDRVRDLNDTANYYFYAPQVRIAYDGKTERRAFFDRHGNRIAAQGDVFEEIYELDERGYRQTLTFTNVRGEAIENRRGIARYEWSVAGDGTVTEKRFTSTGEQAMLRSRFPFYELRLHYGPGGWIALMQNYGLDGQLTMNELNGAQDRLEFAANGDLLSWNVLDLEDRLSRGNGPNVARGIIEPDEHGYEAVERYEDENGNPIESAYGWAYTKAVYDDFGNRIERGNYTLDGKELMISEERGYAVYRIRYDPSGLNRTRIEFFDDRERPAVRVGRGYSRISFAHDSEGNEVRTRYENDRGEPVNRQDTGIAVVERDYDGRGRLTETRFFNAGGDLTDHLRDGYAVERRAYGNHGVLESVRRFTANGRVTE